MAQWTFLLLMNSRTCNFHPPDFFRSENLGENLKKVEDFVMVKNAISKMKIIYHVEASTVSTLQNRSTWHQ